MAINIQKPSIGRIVEVTFNTESGAQKARPAVITNCWGNENINVKVMLDNSNDRDVINPFSLEKLGEAADAGTLWLTSVGYDADGKAGRWRYLPHVADQITVG